jgi:hypothetical protein
MGRTQMIEDDVMNFLICTKGWQFLDQLREYETQYGFYLMESDAEKKWMVTILKTVVSAA